MSRDLRTISARVDEDSDLAQQLDQYQAQNSMTSKSEAVRHLLRSGLEHEFEQPADDVDDEPDPSPGVADADADSGDSQPVIDLNLIQGNEPIILGFAFLLGSNDILAALTAVAGGLGGLLFVAFGIGISAWLLADFASRAGFSLPSSMQRGQPGAE